MDKYFVMSTLTCGTPLLPNTCSASTTAVEWRARIWVGMAQFAENWSLVVCM